MKKKVITCLTMYKDSPRTAEAFVYDGRVYNNVSAGFDLGQKLANIKDEDIEWKEIEVESVNDYIKENSIYGSFDYEWPHHTEECVIEVTKIIQKPEYSECHDIYDVEVEFKIVDTDDPDDVDAIGGCGHTTLYFNTKGTANRVAIGKRYVAVLEGLDWI